MPDLTWKPGPPPDHQWESPPFSFPRHYLLSVQFEIGDPIEVMALSYGTYESIELHFRDRGVVIDIEQPDRLRRYLQCTRWHFGPIPSPPSGEKE